MSTSHDNVKNGRHRRRLDCRCAALRGVWARRGIVAATVVILVMVSAARAGSVRVQDEAGSPSATVTLKQIAELEGDEALALGDVQVATLEPGDAHVTVTLDHVRQALTGRGVNWGRVSLRGFTRCKVYRIEPTPVEVPTAAAARPVVANPDHPIDLTTPFTLRDYVTDKIKQRAGDEGSALQIRFAERDEAVLATALGSDRFAFEARSSNALGRIPIVVERFRGWELVETYRLTATVARSMLAVRTTRGISRGQVFAPSDVEVRELLVTDGRRPPMTDLRSVVGQTSTTILRAGAMVRADEVRAPRVVRRGQFIAVRAFVGDLLIRTDARAMEDGAVGEIIEVRNESTRQSYRVEITGPRAATLVGGATEHEGAKS